VVVAAVVVTVVAVAMQQSWMKAERLWWCLSDVHTVGRTDYQDLNYRKQARNHTDDRWQVHLHLFLSSTVCTLCCIALSLRSTLANPRCDVFLATPCACHCARARLLSIASEPDERNSQL
jgi:hypothetical protein